VLAVARLASGQAAAKKETLGLSGDTSRFSVSADRS